MDIAHDPGVSGLKLTAERGPAVVVSEALRHGRLTRGLPPSVADLWSTVAGRRTLAEWGLTFVWSVPEVSTVVCDMSTMDDVAEDVALADRAEPECLTVQEEVLVSRVREAYRTLRPVNCPSCRACMPCPQGIDVPRIFEIYNGAFMYGDVALGRSIYRDEGHDAGACTKCGTCERAGAPGSCPCCTGWKRRTNSSGAASRAGFRAQVPAWGHVEPTALARCEGAGQAAWVLSWGGGPERHGSALGFRAATGLSVAAGRRCIRGKLRWKGDPCMNPCSCKSMREDSYPGRRLLPFFFPIYVGISLPDIGVCRPHQVYVMGHSPLSLSTSRYTFRASVTLGIPP